MAATNAQVQNFVNEFVRPHAELARQLELILRNDRSIIDDVYANVNDGASTWADNRTDGPPHLLTKADVLAFNTFAEDVATYIANHAQYPVILKACVRPPVG